MAPTIPENSLQQSPFDGAQNPVLPHHSAHYGDQAFQKKLQPASRVAPVHSTQQPASIIPGKRPNTLIDVEEQKRQALLEKQNQELEKARMMMSQSNHAPVEHNYPTSSYASPMAVNHPAANQAYPQPGYTHYNMQPQENKSPVRLILISVIIVLAIALVVLIFFIIKSL